MDQNGNGTTKLKEKILNAIKSGRITMQPRWHFVLKAVLAVAGAFLVLLALLYLSSLVIFSLHRTGAWFAPQFGSRGWFALFRSLPIFILILLLLVVGVLEVLVRRYAFAHRKPLLASALLIVAVAFLGGLALAPWHRGVEMREKFDRPSSPLGRVYRSVGIPHPPDIRRGIVCAIDGNRLLLEDWNGATTTIIMPPSSSHMVSEFPSVGDEMVVLGDLRENVLRAFGIRLLRDEW